MNSSTVNVLTPNGRRMNVKVLPNTTILKVRMLTVPPLQSTAIILESILFAGSRRCLPKTRIRSKVLRFETPQARGRLVDNVSVFWFAK